MMDLKSVSTAKLFEELRKREGVKEIVVQPYVNYELYVKEDGDDESTIVCDSGPASILIVID